MSSEAADGAEGSAGVPLLVRRLGRADYAATWRAMQEFTARRTADTPDEIWLCEHPPVFTLGLAGKAEHLLQDIGVPLVKIDRGGQITYHGPGQLVAYLLLDLRRRQLKVRELVTRIAQAPFAAINPCGYAGMPVTQMSSLCHEPDARDPQRVADRLLHHLQANLP